MRLRCILMLVISLLTATVQAQPPTPEVRQNLIRAMADDTSKVNRMNELADEIQYENPGLAIDLLQTSAALSEKLGYDYGLAVAYSQRATLFFYETKLDSAQRLLDKAQSLIKNKADIQSRKQMAQIVQRYAALHQQRQKYDSAVLLYQEAASRYAEFNDQTKLIFCYYNLSGIYNSLSDTTKTLQYARETRRIALATGDSTFILRGYMALADAFSGMNQYDSVYYMAEQGLAIANRYNQAFPVGKFHLLLGTCFDNRAQYDSAIAHFTIALNMFSLINLGYETSLATYHLGHAYLQKGENKKAIEFLEGAASKSRELKLGRVLVLCLTDLVKAEENLGNIHAGLQYLKEYVAVHDTLTQRNNRQMVYDLETKYQVQQKEAQIELQHHQIRQKNLLNYLLAGAVAGFLIISFFMYYAYRQRRTLHEQRIKELEQERQLLSSEAVIKGQEEERGRLAKDLHDGLGGILSGVKFSLSHMKTNVVLDADNALMFERSLDMLDHSIAELRRVAHNMMPEVLVKFGLNEALKSYCDSIRQSGIFQIDFQFIGNEIRLPSTTEIIVYRLIQELLNNAAKHAQASRVLVQLANHEGELAITVEDNGIGFDASKQDTGKGSGWVNIRSRIEYVKGKLDVQSAAQQGTSIHISIPV